MILIIFSIFIFSNNINEENYTQKKINGVSFVAPRDQIDKSSFNPVKKINANWVCLMPFAFGKKGETELRYNVKRQWWGEKNKGIRKCIEMAHKKGFKVFLKPHVWFSHGFYTGNFNLDSDKEWKKWDKNYKEFIINYASIAEEKGVELFSIGTESKDYIKNRPES
ncbi:MAG: glycoside hydrolase, partial [Flavobacteriales bacterium]